MMIKNFSEHQILEKIAAQFTAHEITASLLIQLNGYIGQKMVERLCNLSGSEIYRRQIAGTFPIKHHIGKGQRKAYRIKDIQEWLSDPTGYSIMNCEVQ